MLAAVFGLLGCREQQEVGVSPAVREVARVAPGPAQQPLRLAVSAMISPAATLSSYEKILSEIARQVGRPYTFVQRRTYREVNELLLAGKLDLAFVCSGAFASLPTDAGVEILAVPVVNGKPLYYSLIIARTESAFGGFENLRGKRFAFTDPLSNTGHFYPRSRVAALGETVGAFFQSTMMTGSHDRSITAVYRKLVDAAAVDSLVHDKVVVPGTRYHGKLKIIERSPGFPIPPVVSPGNVPPALRAKFREALLGLHRNQDTQKGLEKIGVERFVKGDAGAYATIREMKKLAAGIP